MRILSSIFIIGCSFLASLDGNAQSHTKTSYSRKASAIVESYRDSLKIAASKAKAIETGDEDTDVLQNVTFFPYMYRIVGPGVYYSDATANMLSLNYDFPWNREASSLKSQGMNLRNEYNNSIDELLVQTYSTNPTSFRFHDSTINSESVVAQAAVAGAKVEDLDEIYNKVEEIKDVSEVVGDVDVDLQIVKPNFWKTSGKFSLQFTQNYFSENWYKGGNNNVTMLSNLVLEANYNDQNKIQWDNKLDLRLGFLTATSDSCHNFITNNDKIYLYSKLGIKARKSWYYTLSLEGNTQFMPGYRSNDRRVYSDFIAPLDVYVSLGMDFKPSLKKGNTFSLALLPLSYKMRYIGSDEETIHKSYNMVDKDFKQDFGSKIELNSKITVVKNLTWKCRFYYFTSYEYAESELENVFSFQFNKYISSEVYTLWRFDDSRNKNFYDRNLGFFQFKEYFTLGLAYNF